MRIFIRSSLCIVINVARMPKVPQQPLSRSVLQAKHIVHHKTIYTQLKYEPKMH